MIDPSTPFFHDFYMQWVSQFLEMMATEKKATRSTLSAYEADLHSFYAFIKHKRFNQITLQDAQDYLIIQRHLASSTMKRRISSLRQFYTFLITRGYTQENPFPLVKATCPKPIDSPYLREEDKQRLLEGASTWGGAKGTRLLALLEILYSRSVSINDLVALPFPVEEKMQAMNLSLAALNALQNYLLVRSCFLSQGKESRWLFPSSSQRGHLTRQRVGQLLKELALKVELDPKWVSLTSMRQGLQHYRQKDAVNS